MSSQEQRLTSRLISYWENIRGEATLPPYAQLNPSALDELWNNCLVLRTEPAAAGKLSYSYTHCGQEISKAIGKDLTGQRMTSNMKFFPGAKIIKRIDEVATQVKPTPLLDDGQFINEKNQIIKYRACLLAFGNTQGISHVVIGVSWRAF